MLCVIFFLLSTVANQKSVEKQKTSITTSTKRPEGTDCWQRCCLRWFPCVGDYVWKRLSLHECFLSLRSSECLFCCMILLKKVGGRVGGEQGSMPLGFGGLQRYLPFSCFLRFCSHSVYFNFFAIMGFFLTFLYLCNCCHRFCLSICLFGLRRRNLSSSHLSEVKEKKRNNRMYLVLYTGNQVPLFSIHIM